MGEVNVIAFFITVLSHLTLLPTIQVLASKRLVFEVCVSGFGLLASVMYHTCQCLCIQFFFVESQWHKLDNVGVVALIGLMFVHLSAITNRLVEKVARYVVFFIAIASQEQHPWDVRFTVAPILLFALIPITQHFLVNKSFPPINQKCLYLGLLSICVSVVFFVLGLNDAGDPYRILHGMWHCTVGIASYYLWRVINVGTFSPTSKVSHLAL